MLSPEFVDELVNRLTIASDRVCADAGAGDIGDEDDFASQLCARLKDAVAALDDELSDGEFEEAPELPHVMVRARHLKWRGPKSEEARLGADIIVVIDIRLGDQRVTKGILIQAKMLSPGADLPNKEIERLRKQCADMLKITPAAFIFFCSPKLVRPISASAVESSLDGSMWEIESYPLSIFYKDFIISWIGDRRIPATDAKSLLSLMQLFGVPNALTVQVFDSPDVPDLWLQPG